MNNKQNILLIPSWYPSEKHPYSGVFFKEQAILMSNRFNIIVLYGIPEVIGKKSLVKSILLRNNRFGKPSLFEAIGTGYKEYHFKYPVYAFMSNKSQIKYSNKYFKKAFDLLCFIPDLIHAQSNFKAGIFSSFLANTIKCKLLITEHLPLIIRYFPVSLKDFYINSLENADCISTVSEYSRGVLMDNIPNKEVINHGNFIDEDTFILRKSNVNTLFSIGWVGSLYYRKDPFTFLRVVKYLFDKGFSFQARMIFAYEKGEINIKTIEKFISDNKLNCIIDISFNVNRNQLVEFYHSIDVLICTSISETFGMVIAESLMCGTPVISSNCGGVQDIIDDKLNGFITKIGDYELMSLYAIEIMGNRKYFDSTFLRNSIVLKYGRVKFENSMSDLYQKIIK